METVYLNGSYLPREDARISPDDRGFLFADGIYEVVRWYGNGFYDMPGHIVRLKRSLRELDIRWEDAETFAIIARDLISRNGLDKSPAMVYIQVTRGAAKRTHYYPVPPVSPTVYAFAFGFVPDREAAVNGVKVMVKEDPRWNRCDIKSVSLLPNTMSFQEAYSAGYKECVFVRDGFITECAHSNIFFVLDGVLRTHPESNHILSGISRKNLLRMALETQIPVSETAVAQKDLSRATEAFITNTSAEVTPVTEAGGITIGSGLPGPLTLFLQERFRKETDALKA
jgi:D-alanine transaminase